MVCYRFDLRILAYIIHATSRWFTRSRLPPSKHDVFLAGISSERLLRVWSRLFSLSFLLKGRKAARTLLLMAAVAVAGMAAVIVAQAT